MRVTKYLLRQRTCYLFFFFFNDTATTEIYTLSLHDALPIFPAIEREAPPGVKMNVVNDRAEFIQDSIHEVEFHLVLRSEEHTSELQSRQYLVCRLLLEKKNLKHFHDSATARFCSADVMLRSP